ncbi:Ig-like domain-containing protein, partial [Sphingobium sp. DC-2]|uniref:Ig-like domain-containing protein n=1 Tax=Sphingobium sp. DC-2 TaxID=1303256 RepID=UPI0004C3E0FD
TDGDGSADSASLDVRISDDIPDARDDSAAALEDSSVIINVVANDLTGADGVALATGVSLVTGPAKGSLIYNGDGSFTYTPNAGATGSDSFTYSLKDGDGDSASATVTVLLAADSTPRIMPSTAAVSEAGLPSGSDPASASETAAGVLAIDTGADRVAQLLVGGVDVTAGGTVSGSFGILQVTRTDAGYSYSYTLTAPASGEEGQDQFSVKVTDSDGSVGVADLLIRISDDAPRALADSDGVSEDGPLVADGNVLTGIGGSDANGSDGVADVQGADGAAISSAGTFKGVYGTLTLEASGLYSYRLDNENPLVQTLSPGETLTDSFSYSITDGDGDVSSSTLTITISGSDDGVGISGLDGEGAEVLVSEAHLADGSAPDAAALTRTGSFSISTPDGLAAASVEGVSIFAGGAFKAAAIVTAEGTLRITGFTPVTGPDGSVTGGSFAYSYELTGNSLAHGQPGTDSILQSFTVTITDGDGSADSASLDVRI